jgi:uncharacterized membrane protein YhhN
MMFTTLLCAVLVLGLLFAEAGDHSVLKAGTKVPASLAFIATALLSGQATTGPFSELVVVGLVLGAIGDAALLSREQRPFRLGIAAFLLSHVAYIAAFMVLGVSWTGCLAALLVLAPLAVGIRRWIGDKAGPLARAVTAYVVVITAMVTGATGAVVYGISTQRLVLLAAAVLFFVSDICVARDRFVAPGMMNRIVGLPLYYAAQLLFAWSLAISG